MTTPYGLPREDIVARLQDLVKREWDTGFDAETAGRIQRDRECSGVLFEGDRAYVTNGVFFARVGVSDQPQMDTPFFLSYQQGKDALDINPFARHSPDLSRRLDVILDEWRQYCVRVELAKAFEWLDNTPALKYATQRRGTAVSGRIVDDGVTGRKSLLLELITLDAAGQPFIHADCQALPIWGREEQSPRPDELQGRFAVNAAFFIEAVSVIKGSYHLADFRFNAYDTNLRYPLLVAGENWRQGKPQIRIGLMQVRVDPRRN